MSAPFLIAWRYLMGSRLERAVSTMALICFLGMVIGSAALALVVSVMAGFERETHKTLQGIHAQIIMQSPGNDLDIEKINLVLHDEFSEVKAASPYLLKQIIIQKPSSQDISHVVFLKGIIPEQEEQVSAIAQKIISPKNSSFAQLIHKNHILIGKHLADTLDLKIGDPLTILFAEHDHTQGRSITMAQATATVGGIFKTGIAECDEGCAYGSLSFVQSLFPDESVSHIAVTLAPHADEATTIQALADRFSLSVYSWKELYPALVSALKLEKYAMFFILLLITLVAGMNIISLLYMQITRKRADIAILKAMGMADAPIRHIFLIMGLAIAVTGCAVGLGLAAFIGMLLQRYPFIELPDTYYVSHLPIVMDPIIFAMIFICVLLISMIATILPLQTIKHINVAQVLRFEG